jgi:hypothetical protein
MNITAPSDFSHLWDTFEAVDIFYDDYGLERGHIIEAQGQFLEYISEIKNSNAIPQRSHVNPLKIVSFLPRIMMLDQSADEISVRLSGTAIDRLYGNITGNNIDNLNDDDLSKYWKSCVDKVMQTRKPIVTRSKINFIQKSDCSITTLIIPLSSDGENISQFLFLFDLID